MSIFKNKFIIKNDITEGQYVPDDKSNVIDNESLLSRNLKQTIKRETKSELSSILPIREMNNRNEVAGSGFGNLNISNDIRLGNPSRSNNKEYKEKREKQLTFDYQFNYLIKRSSKSK
jgi:hypothetical protein